MRIHLAPSFCLFSIVVGNGYWLLNRLSIIYKKQKLKVSLTPEGFQFPEFPYIISEWISHPINKKSYERISLFQVFLIL